MRINKIVMGILICAIGIIISIAQNVGVPVGGGIGKPSGWTTGNCVTVGSSTLNTTNCLTTTAIVQTGQTSAIGTTTIVTPSSDGLYRVSGAVVCDSVSALAEIGMTVGWTDTSNTVQTLVLGSNAICTSLGPLSIADLTNAMRVKSSIPITYSTAIVNTPTYSISIAATRIGD